MSSSIEEWRVIAVYRDIYKVSNGNEVLNSKITGSFRNRINSRSDFPTVGDWVGLNKGKQIDQVYNRKNHLSRKQAGKKVEEQLLAANIDIMFIVTSLNKEFNIGKIGRYIILAQTNHIKPVILLSKLDLCDNKEEYIEKVLYFYPKMDIICLSAKDGIGVEEVYNSLYKDDTAVFVGSSGVGKSTLINKLIGNNTIKTNNIREKDDKGRHTTTNRELYKLENGAFVIDTPGIREVGLWINDIIIDEFQDVYLLAQACKYRNCNHINDDGCAVKKAVDLGEIKKETYKNFLDMTRKIQHAKLEQDEAARQRLKQKSKLMCKNERYTRR